jgi:DHA2 family multidrug resistance protein-like MFS transporter
MAVVPVAAAGIASAVNDVTRELGGALGIALMGSLVNGWYRSDVESSLAGQMPAGVLALTRQGVGVARLAAAQLLVERAATVTAMANLAFVDAMTNGFIVSAAILIATLEVVLTMISVRMRQNQATADQSLRSDPPVTELRRELQPVPVCIDQ